MCHFALGYTVKFKVECFGVEQGLRDRNDVPNAGLWHSTKFDRDDAGNAVKVLGFAAVETFYSRFMD
ncbi:hypothetical protein PsAD26_01876 [Pseudovibrio sp. Ad26]|nr:hypothetical protein PsAD26_01876 [Pseudovibrio sp. Ad26]